MEITSFILGISFAVVVSMLAVTVYNLFRVHKLNKEMRELSELFNLNFEQAFTRIEAVNERIGHNNSFQWDRFKSEMDSRIDKLLLRIQTTGNQTVSTDGRKQLLDKQILKD